jgi:hypothetical protein
VETKKLPTALQQECPYFLNHNLHFYRDSASYRGAMVQDIGGAGGEAWGYST